MARKLYPLGIQTFSEIRMNDNLYIVDQHAAHERLTYEKMTRQYAQNPEVQVLLIPEIVTLTG